MVELQPSKLAVRVRFPLPAPFLYKTHAEVTESEDKTGMGTALRRLCWMVVIGWMGMLTVQAQVQLTGRGWEVRYRAGRGIELRVAGVLLSYGSWLQFADPNWTRGYYSSSSGAPEVLLEEEQIKIIHRLKEYGQAVETLRISNSTVLEWQLEVDWLSDAPAIAEWCVGLWNADYVRGARLRGVGALQAETLGAVPATTNGDVLFSGERLEFQARLARLAVSAVPPSTLTVLDGRANWGRWWSRETPTLWFGTPGTPVTKGTRLTLMYRFEIYPNPHPASVESEELRATIRPVPNRWEPTPEEPLLIPPPKIRWTGQGEPFVMPAERPVAVYLEDEVYRPCAVILSRALNRYGLQVEIHRGTPPKPKAIFIGGGRALQRRHPVPDQPGAYYLEATTERIEIVGRDVEGAVNGTHTLTQLLQPTLGAVQVRPERIVDYPHLRFRGVHLFGSPQPQFLPRLIENVLAPLKFNHLVIECGHAQWEATRPAWGDNDAPKPLLREAVETARKHLIEPIPLIQSLGHMGWAFRNGANLDLAEDPDTPWALAPRRPESRQFLQRLYDEVFELFQPRMFHVGLDEVTNRGRFPYRPESVEAAVGQLLTEHAEWLVSELRGRGVERVLMWGDMLLAPGEAHDGAANAASPGEAQTTRARLSRLPELIICDWHYTPTAPENYKSVSTLKSAGFKDIIVSTWFNPLNIHTFARSARQQRLMGLLQTTWAGHTIDQRTLSGREYHQFIAYGYASMYAWDSDLPPPPQLPLDMERVFASMYQQEAVPLEARPGFLVDFTAHGNFDMRNLHMAFERLNRLEVALSPYAGGAGSAGEPMGNPSLLLDPVRLGGHLFQINPGGTLMLAGYLVPDTLLPYPREVRLTLNRPAKALYFLHTTAFPTERGAEVARYIFEYADGTTAEQPLLYGVHLRAWNDAGPAFEGIPIWSQRMENGVWMRVRLLKWQNPHPEKPIRTLRIRATDPVASLIVVAISGE